MKISKNTLEWLAGYFVPQSETVQTFIDSDSLPFNTYIEDRIDIIRQAALAYIHQRFPRPIADLVTINAYKTEIPSDWRSEIFYINGEYNALFAQLFPAAHQVLLTLCQNHPAIQGIGISMLGSKSRIEPHQDYNPLFYRYHLPLVCDSIGNTITVGEDKRNYQEGKGLAFDFTSVHSVQNSSDNPRINLMIDFYKPDVLKRLGPAQSLVLALAQRFLRLFVPELRHLQNSLPQYDQVRIGNLVRELDTSEFRNYSPLVMCKLWFYRLCRLKKDQNAIKQFGAPQIDKLGLNANDVDNYTRMICMAVYADWAGAELYTMLPRKRLDNIVECCSHLISNQVPDAFLEAGVWRGGAGILMRHVSCVLRDDREVYLLDSFSGMENISTAPVTGHSGNEAELHDTHSEEECDVLCSQILEKAAQHFEHPVISTSVELVQRNIEKKLGTVNGFTLIQGWFSPTFPWHEVPELAMLRLDCDYYWPTRHCLEGLYDKLAPGGWVILDEYYLPHFGERLAVDEFRAARGINDRIVRIDENSGYWIKSSAK
ncbi:MAG: hypothetical protein GKR94_31930 [Gammaproteobacteria bacterium]|nr:hypothetical protein [Gammaproteobacteria bacterium]